MDIVVAGGGLAGLTAAAQLGDRALVLEKEAWPGGLLRSPQAGGFTIDLVPHVFFTTDLKALRFFEEAVGQENFRLQDSDIRVFSHGVLTRFPFQCNLYGLPPDVIIDCLLGFAAAAARPKGKVANFAEFAQASFGEGIVRHFLAPYNTKLWGVASLSELATDWVGGKVVTLNMRDVVEGAILDRRYDRLPNAQFRYPIRGGIQALGEGVARKVRNLRLETEIETIDFRAKRVRLASGEELAWRFMVYTLPLSQIPALSSTPVPVEVAQAAAALRFRDVYAVHLGVRPKMPNPWHWTYYPENEYPFYRVSFPSNMSPETVPEGTSSVIAEVAVNPGQEMDEAALIDQCIDGLFRSRMLGPTDSILHRAVYRLSPAYVVYDHARRDAVQIVHSWLSTHDVVPAGRFGEWRFFNMDHTILSGMRAAAVVQGALKAPRGRVGK